MKKQLILLILLVIGITLVGCNIIEGAANTDKEIVPTAIDKNELKINDYFPYLENTLLRYTGQGNEFASQDVYFEFIDGNRAQVKIINPGTNLVKVLELKDGMLSEIFVEGEFYHIENMINSKAERKEIVLKEPLAVGNSWTTPEGYTKEISSIDSMISTPSGSYVAVEVTTTFEEGRIQKDFYAKGVGLVLRLYIDGETEISTTLTSIENTSFDHEILLFYPHKENEKTIYVKDNLSFNTNDKIEKLIEYKLKNPPDEELGITLPRGVLINSIHLDRAQWIVNVDFSKELLTELNAGSSYENEILISIVSTLGKFYDTDKVYISVEGRPYESGHFAIREGEVFKVNTSEIEEFK